LINHTYKKILKLEMAAGLGTDSFLILGHGQEDIVDFNERPELPAGYTLVTIAECGVVTLEEDVCPLVEAFGQETNRHIFANPIANSTAIETFMRGKQIHIYTAGNKYPKLEIQYFLDWPTERNTKITKSGTYKFPLDPAKFQIAPGATFMDRLFKLIGPYKGFMKGLPDDFSPKEMFEGSMFPTLDFVEAAVNADPKPNSSDLKEQLTKPLEEVFEAGGPGIYYYVVCRSPRLVLSPSNLVNFDLGLNKNKYSPYLINDWTTKLNELIPILEANTGTKRGWIKSELEGTLKNYRRLRRVPLIRQASLDQQSGRAATAAAAAAGAAAGTGGAGTSAGGSRRKLRRTMRVKRRKSYRKYSEK
jgi:hypothetical protein